MQQKLRVALISETFYGENVPERLTQTLIAASSQGADLAVLPELALNPWSPATKTEREEDAEPIGGIRTQIQADACRAAGLHLLGSVLSLEGGKRLNTAVLFSPSGDVLGGYSKTHLPQEPGFWETSHYVAGDSLGVPLVVKDFPFGIQICSDLNRSEGSHILSAMGALAIICPRSTELATYERWRHVFFANAITSCCYVLSVNRPRPEDGVLIGGPSIAVSPRGELLAESTDTICVVELSSDEVVHARHLYPGYLAIRSDIYASSWQTISPRPVLPFDECS